MHSEFTIEILSTLTICQSPELYFVRSSLHGLHIISRIEYTFTVFMRIYITFSAV